MYGGELGRSGVRLPVFWAERPPEIRRAEPRGGRETSRVREGGMDGHGKEI